MTSSFKTRCALRLSQNHQADPPEDWNPAWKRAVLHDTEAVLSVVRERIAEMPCYPSCADHDPCLMCLLREELET